MKNSLFMLCLLVFLVAIGCSGNKRLSGKVTFSDDGSPVPNGMVIFSRDNFISRGEIQSDGTYKLSSERENDGIPPGEYKVYVSGISEMPPSIPGVMTIPIPLCDPKFEDPSTSGLTCTIPAPGSRFDFAVDRR